MVIIETVKTLNLKIIIYASSRDTSTTQDTHLVETNLSFPMLFLAIYSVLRSTGQVYRDTDLILPTFYLLFLELHAYAKATRLQSPPSCLLIFSSTRWSNHLNSRFNECRPRELTDEDIFVPQLFVAIRATCSISNLIPMKYTCRFLLISSLESPPVIYLHHRSFMTLLS